MSEHVSPKSVYYSIFGALMVLTTATVLAAYVNLGRFNAPVALAIATFKATLVVLFFMHVKYSSRLTKLIVLTSLFFLANPDRRDDDGLRDARAAGPPAAAPLTRRARATNGLLHDDTKALHPSGGRAFRLWRRCESGRRPPFRTAPR